MGAPPGPAWDTFEEGGTRFSGRGGSGSRGTKTKWGFIILLCQFSSHDVVGGPEMGLTGRQIIGAANQER